TSMARDYSSRRDNRSGKKNGKKNKPAAKPVRRKRTSGSRSRTSRTSNRSGCAWTISAILLLIVVAAVFYIATRPAGEGPRGTELSIGTEDSGEQARESEESGDHSEEATEDSVSDDAGAAAEPEFSFY